MGGRAPHVDTIEVGRKSAEAPRNQGMFRPRDERLKNNDRRLCLAEI